MPGRLVLMIRWIALFVLVAAIALIIARWKLPNASRSKEHTGSLWNTLKTLLIRWRRRRQEVREDARNLVALKRKRVLLVGAEDKYLRAIRWNLEALDCVIVRARTGAQALSIARDHKPDALVVDTLLPDMSALDFYELYEDKNTPIAFVGVNSQYWSELSKLGPRVVCASDDVEPGKLIGQLGRTLRIASKNAGDSRSIHHAIL